MTTGKRSALTISRPFVTIRSWFVERQPRVSAFAMKTAKSKFSGRESVSRARVRYAETDQMGVAYYANYFVWFEVGRSQYCNDCGFSYRDMERETGLFLIV